MTCVHGAVTGVGVPVTGEPYFRASSVAPEEKIPASSVEACMHPVAPWRPSLESVGRPGGSRWLCHCSGPAVSAARVNLVLHKNGRRAGEGDPLAAEMTEQSPQIVTDSSSCSVDRSQFSFFCYHSLKMQCFVVNTGVRESSWPFTIGDHFLISWPVFIAPQTHSPY